MIIEFGDRYRDYVTGFEGIATARTETIHGSVTICLERPDEKGLPEEVWLPQERLEAADRDNGRKVGL